MPIDKMSEKTIKTYADILENTSSVEFLYNGCYYEIFESFSDDGYVVNLYPKDDEDGYLENNLIDGGLCTGSAIDAVQFML